MKILHVTPAFVPASVYGGPIESVFQLCRHLVRAGCDVRVLTTDANGRDDVLAVETGHETRVDGGFGVRYCRRRARHTVSPALLRLLPSYVRWADVVHLTGVYSFPTWPTLLTSRLEGKPVIWSPRGAWQRWRGTRRTRLKKGWDGVARAMAPRGLVLHTTSADEARDTERHFPGFSVVVIENGVEVPARIERNPAPGMLRLLYIGRLDPIKGLENLLAACGTLEGRIAGSWSLTIAGGGAQDYSAHLRESAAGLGLGMRVRFVGHREGEEKRALFENADIFVLPSFGESFGLVIAEALAHGVPVVASRGTPWRRVEEMGCGLWVENTPPTLAEAIERISRMPLAQMGQVGRDWMTREFDWARRALDMADVYRTTAWQGA